MPAGATETRTSPVVLALDCEVDVFSRQSRELASTYPSWPEVVAGHVVLYDSRRHLERAII
jgi:hypothetical protein